MDLDENCGLIIGIHDLTHHKNQCCQHKVVAEQTVHLSNDGYFCQPKPFITAIPKPWSVPGK